MQDGAVRPKGCKAKANCSGKAVIASVIRAVLNCYEGISIVQLQFRQLKLEEFHPCCWQAGEVLLDAELESIVGRRKMVGLSVDQFAGEAKLISAWVLVTSRLSGLRWCPASFAPGTQNCCMSSCTNRAGTKDFSSKSSHSCQRHVSWPDEAAKLWLFEKLWSKVFLVMAKPNFFLVISVWKNLFSKGRLANQGVAYRNSYSTEGASPLVAS